MSVRTRGEGEGGGADMNEDGGEGYTYITPFKPLFHVCPVHREDAETPVEVALPHNM